MCNDRLFKVLGSVGRKTKLKKATEKELSELKSMLGDVAPADIGGLEIAQLSSAQVELRQVSFSAVEAKLVQKA